MGDTSALFVVFWVRFGSGGWVEEEHGKWWWSGGVGVMESWGDGVLGCWGGGVVECLGWWDKLASKEKLC
jgi:hypothetical protein